MTRDVSAGERLLSCLTERLSQALSGATSILVTAEPELLPAEVARCAAGLLGDEKTELPLSVAARETSWAYTVTSSTCLVLEVDEASDPVQDHDAVLEAASRQGTSPVVIVVSESDERVAPEVAERFQVVLDGSSLLVSDDDLLALEEAWLSVERRRALLSLTGGVLSLVMAALDELAQDGEDPDVESLLVRTGHLAWCRSCEETTGLLASAARDWAERIYDLVAADPLLHLHAFLPLLSPWSVAKVATQVLGREVTLEEVRRCEQSTALLRDEDSFVRFAPALAAQLVQVTLVRNPALAAVLRRDLTEVCVRPETDLPTRAVIFMLVGLQGWAVLDRYLAGHLIYMGAFSHRERSRIARFLPDQVPQGWSYLRRAREFLLMEEMVPHQLPQRWLELAWLATSGDDTQTDQLTQEVGVRGTAAFSQVHSPRMDVVQGGFEDISEWLREEAARISEETVGTYVMSNSVYEHAVVICLMILGACDAEVSLGRFSQAQRLLRLVSNLVETCTIGVVRSPVLCTGLVARQALLAAHAGVSERAEAFLTGYEQTAAAGGVREAEAEHLVQVARRFLASGVAHPVRVSTEIRGNTQLTPMEVEAEALLVLVQRGPDAVREWIASFLGRAEWTDLEPFEWWPLHLLLTLLDVREGKIDDAVARAQSCFLPQDARLLVEAGASLLRGDGEDCRRRVETLSTMPGASPRWVLVAYGLRLGVLVGAGGYEAEIAIEIEAHRERWRDNPGLVALLPDEARERILPEIDSVVASCPGLRLEDERPVAVAPLTPRQMDVLTLMAQGSTLPEIAEDLFLGVETVRSTSKAIYKRLGVHDRDAAVRVARLSGLI